MLLEIADDKMDFVHSQELLPDYLVTPWATHVVNAMCSARTEITKGEVLNDLTPLDFKMCQDSCSPHSYKNL